MTETRHYDETTAEDFKRLFVERFPGGDTAILDMALANPARREHPSTGSIAYDDAGGVKAILGLVPRVVYCGQKRVAVTNGVAIAVRKDADRAFFPDFIRDAVRDDGAGMFFVNTAIPPSRKRVRAVLGVDDGPESCAAIRERPLRSNGLLSRALRKLSSRLRKLSPLVVVRLLSPLVLRSRPSSALVVVRLLSSSASLAAGDLLVTPERDIADADFNCFWATYLKTNQGLVSSRTAEELRWLFGKGLASGEVVLLAARKDGALQGYAFCRRTDETATCWRVVDMIALKNDETVLAALVEGASRYLRKRTPALCLQITGYPTWVQPLLQRLFPKCVPFGFNKCIWVYLNDAARTLCGDWVNAESGWYGCPYDGDMCLM